MDNTQNIIKDKVQQINKNNLSDGSLKASHPGFSNQYPNKKKNRNFIRKKKNKNNNISSKKLLPESNSKRTKTEIKKPKQKEIPKVSGVPQKRETAWYDDQLKEKFIVIDDTTNKNESEGKREPQQSLSNWENYKKKQKNTPQDQRELFRANAAVKKKNRYELIGLSPEEGTNKGETPIIAIDCEMVLCEKYPKGPQAHEIARISIVNYNGHVLMDEFIRPTYKIINYLTWVSGITFEKVQGKPTFAEVKEKVYALLKNKKIVGHTLKSDFEALHYTANQDQLRDLSKMKILKDEQSRVVSLKKMALKYLKEDIQRGQHCSVEDARACMYIYKRFQEEIEKEFKTYNQRYGDAKSKMLQDLERDKEK